MRPPMLHSLPMQLLGAASSIATVMPSNAAPRPPQASTELPALLANSLDPASFTPVCPASDSLYRLAQQIVVNLVGGESYREYAPLIAGGLLRVRLELCVVESFVYEAIIPFVKTNGLSWVLPLHETVETFLAGVIFAVASNFILIGSTKLFTVVATYADVFVGLPSRLIGGTGWRQLEDRAMPAPAVEAEPPPENVLDRAAALFKGPPPRKVPPLSVVIKANTESDPVGVAAVVGFGSLKALGEVSGGVRRAVEALDVFVGRYLLLTTVAYVSFKFVHFKVFPDFP